MRFRPAFFPGAEYPEPRDISEACDGATIDKRRIDVDDVTEIRHPFQGMRRPFPGRCKRPFFGGLGFFQKNTESWKDA